MADKELENRALREERRSGRRPAPRPAPGPVGSRLSAAVRSPMLVAVTIIAVGGVVNTALPARHHDIVLIERGLTPRAVQ